MATKTIEFQIIGNDQLSAALKNAQKNLRGLTNATLSANAKALNNAQANLKNIEAYKKLQAAILANNAAQIQARADQSKILKQRQEAVAQLGDMKKAYAQLRDAYKANWISMGTQAALAMKEQLRAAANEIKTQERTVRNLDRAYDSLPNHARKLQEQLSTQQAQLAHLRTQIPTANIAAAESALRAQINQTTQALNQEIAALERRNQIHQNFSRAGQDLSNAYSNLQGAVDTAQTLLNPFTTATQKAIAFQYTMDTLKSISQMDLISQGNLEQAEKNMRRLRAQAKELGATTIFNAQEVGEAQVYVARTGWDSDAVEAAMPHLARLAAANRTSLERTADIATNVMTAFGHGPKEVAHDADVFNYTVNHSNQTLEQFGEAMSYAAPVAKLFGATLEETAMMTKFSSDAGVQASRAGTSVRQTLLRLTAPPKKASKAMEELGVSTSDATKAWNEANEVAASLGVTMDSSLSPGRQFIHIMEQIDKGFVGKSDNEKLAGLGAITGVTAVSGAANIFGAGADKARNFTELLENCRGTLERTYSVMTDNTFGAQKSFESAWEAVQLSTGEAFLAITQGAYEFAAPLLTSLSQFIDRNPAVVQGLAAIATTASVATVGIAGFSLAMAGVRFAQAGFATAGLMFGTLTTKVTALRTALTGLTLGNIGASLSGGLAAATAGIRAFGAATLSAARAGLMFMFTPIGAALTAIALAAYYAYQNWDKVSAAFSKIGNAFTSSLAPAIDGVVNAFSRLTGSIGLESLMTGFSNLASYLGGGFVGAIAVAVGTLTTLISGAGTLVLGLVQTVVEAGAGIIDTFGKLKDGDFSGAFESLTQVGSQAAKNFEDSFRNAFAAVEQNAQGVNAALESLMTAPQVSGGGVGALQAQIAQVDTSQITQPIADASTQAADSLNQVAMPAQATGQSLMTVPPAADALSAALPSPISGLDALGPAASSAASALEGAAARFNSIQINVPQINYVPMSVPVAPVAANASGGIYSKGAFLTTFAESSGEAAIPLNHSKRSFDLWKETGDILGVDSATAFSLNLTFNIQGDADENKIRSEVVPLFERSFAEQLRNYNLERRRRSFV